MSLRKIKRRHDARVAVIAADRPDFSGAATVLVSCGDCDPCIGGKPGSCAVGAYRVLAERKTRHNASRQS